MDETSFLKELKEKDFKYLSKLIYYHCGINLHEGKKELVRARLCSRLRQLELNTFSEYCKYVEEYGGQKEIIFLIDTLSTNYTYFFREIKHFQFLRKELPLILEKKTQKRDSKLRIWSAGCSSGEEPYSIAVILEETLVSYPQIDAKILATDISDRVIGIAKEGIYVKEKFSKVPPNILSKYFKAKDDNYIVRDRLRRTIQFSKLNIVGNWPFKGPFDFIFCRNVMIYFDHETRNVIVKRFTDYLKPEGYLFLGNSESLIGIENRLKYVQPSLYQKSLGSA